MKKIITALFVLSILVCANCRAESVSFLTEDEIITGADFLPTPPKPDEATFYNDWMRYQWGKSMRNTERGKQAIKDADYTFEYFIKMYSEPFGMTISKENTPEISALLERVFATATLCKDKAKANIMRVRPFTQFNEPTPLPEEEEELKNNSSYPSGHTTIGWAIALVLAEINIEHQDEILKRGFEYGDNRVIVGFHYQSDVDNARMLASILVNHLHANDEFMTLLKKAKDEFTSKQALQN